jgi:hypothetical protein
MRSVLTEDMVGCTLGLSFCFAVRANRSQKLRVVACEEVRRACASSVPVLRGTRRGLEGRSVCAKPAIWRSGGATCLHHGLKEVKVKQKDERKISAAACSSLWSGDGLMEVRKVRLVTQDDSGIYVAISSIFASAHDQRFLLSRMRRKLDTLPSCMYLSVIRRALQTVNVQVNEHKPA